MVQYNKNLINNETVNIVRKNNQKGGSLQKMFYESNIVIKIIVTFILSNILSTAIELMYTFKLNGVIYPIIFGGVFYNLYVALTFHMKKLGLSLTENNNKNESKIVQIINDMITIVQTFPKLIPSIPQIPEPRFKKQPFKGIREGIRSLMIPYKFNGDDYRLKINFPKVQIPFLDPLAGICCVWSKFKKLLELFEKAFKIPKKAIEKIAKVFIKIFNGIKKGICLAIKNIKYLITAVCSPIIVIVYTVIGFLKVINALKKGSMDNAINKLKKFVSGITNFEPKGVKCGGGFKNNTKYEKNDVNDYIINYNGPCITDIYSKIDVLNYENKFKDKVCEKKVKKMSIFKIHRKELEQKHGLMKYMNKYTNRKFNTFRKQKLDQKINETRKYKKNTNIYKPNFIYYNSAQHDYMSPDEINELKQDLDFVNENQDNLNNIQKGGGLGKFVRKLKKLKNIFRDIPKYVNIICVIVNKISNLIRKIGQGIYDIGNKITFGVPRGIKKFGKLISFIGKIIEWFIQTIIGKGVRIIEAAVELVFNLSLGNLPKAISTKIFKPIKAIFTLLLKIVKLPFITFFMEIVEILTDIPRRFNMFADMLQFICNTIKKIINAIVNGLMAPIKKTINKLKKAARVFKKFGGKSITSNTNIQDLLNKHNYELNLMIKRKYELIKDATIDKNYLLKLDELILKKKKKIEEIKKYLLKFNKVKTGTSKNPKNPKNNLISKQLTYK